MCTQAEGQAIPYSAPMFNPKHGSVIGLGSVLQGPSFFSRELRQLLSMRHFRAWPKLDDQQKSVDHCTFREKWLCWKRKHKFRTAVFLLEAGMKDLSLGKKGSSVLAYECINTPMTEAARSSRSEQLFQKSTGFSALVSIRSVKSVAVIKNSEFSNQRPLLEAPLPVNATQRAVSIK